MGRFSQDIKEVNINSSKDNLGCAVADVVRWGFGELLKMNSTYSETTGPANIAGRAGDSSGNGSLVMRKSSSAENEHRMEVPREFESRLESIGPGEPLGKNERRYFEPRFGINLSEVRIHRGKEADSLAKGVNARAFTRGEDIVFAEGEYSPGTDEGKRLLAHELGHVVQQGDVTDTFRRSVKLNSIFRDADNSLLFDHDEFVWDVQNGYFVFYFYFDYPKSNKAVDLWRDLNLRLFSHKDWQGFVNWCKHYLDSSGEVVQSEFAELKCYASFEGDEDYNLGLGYRRGASIINWLQKKFKEIPFQIDVVSLGEKEAAQPVGGIDPNRDVRQKDRRVELTIKSAGTTFLYTYYTPNEIKLILDNRLFKPDIINVTKSGNINYREGNYHLYPGYILKGAVGLLEKQQMKHPTWAVNEFDALIKFFKHAYYKRLRY